MPAVSILTPAYRHAGRIQACIRSVQAQTFEDWEMLVVDDGSDDGTAEAAEALAEPRVRVLRQPHRGIDGLAETYNAGLAECRAELVAILEGDDLWLPHKLELQVPDFADPAVALSAGMAAAIDEDGVCLALIPGAMPPPEVLANEPVGRASAAMLHPQVLTFSFPVTVVARRAALEAIGGFHQPPGLPLVDYPTLLRLGLQGAWRFHAEAVVGLWRRHGGSITLSRFPWILEGCYAEAARFAREHPSLPGLDEVGLELAWERFQFERALSLHRWHRLQGDRGQAAGFLGRAGAFRRSRLGTVRLGLARVLAGLGQSTELVLAPGRPPADHLMRLDSGDAAVSPRQVPDDLGRHAFRA